MNYSIFIILFIQGYLAFFLDGITNAPGGNTLSDKHFNMLMELLHDERQSRIKLENVVILLQQELTDTRLICASCNGTDKTLQRLETRVSEIENKTGDTCTDNAINQTTYSSLQKAYDSLQKDFEALKNKSSTFEQEFTNLKQLKGVSDSKQIIALENKTKYLETEIKKTNLNVGLVLFDASARKQDFIALLNKTDAMEFNYGNEIQAIKKWNNETAIEIQKHEQEIAKIKNRVAVTSCVKNEMDMKRFASVPFEDVKLVHGYLNGTSITATGNFTAEISGTYLVTAYIQTSTSDAGFAIFRNDIFVADAFMSLTSNYQTGTAISLTELTIGDTISVQTRRSMHIYGDIESCISILQVQ